VLPESLQTDGEFSRAVGKTSQGVGKTFQASGEVSRPLAKIPRAGGKVFHWVWKILKGDRLKDQPLTGKIGSGLKKVQMYPESSLSVFTKVLRNRLLRLRGMGAS